jgi:acetyl/propionyl-CoA carboxylase alpha subunit
MVFDVERCRPILGEFEKENLPEMCPFAKIRLPFYAPCDIKYSVCLSADLSTFSLRESNKKQKRRVQGKMEEILEAPLPGKILSVDAKVGDVVDEGDSICTLEAMKMENPILAPVKGTVKEIAVQAGSSVQTGDKIAVIES